MDQFQIEEVHLYNNLVRDVESVPVTSRFNAIPLRISDQSSPIHLIYFSAVIISQRMCTEILLKVD